MVSFPPVCFNAFVIHKPEYPFEVPILGTDLAVYVDVKKNLYSIVNLSTGKLLKTYSTTVPIKEVVVTDKVELFK